MYHSSDKTKQALENVDHVNKLDKPAIVDKLADKVIAVSYPLSFLLLESEEDSFVKGYN